MQNPKEEYIGCLSLILILWLVGGVVSFFASIVYVIAMPLPAVAIFVLICKVVYLAGLLLMLMRKKSGFYLFVGSCVLMLLAGLLYPESFDDTWVFRIPLALLLILILMAIKNKKTKLNGYQVLGITESDEDFDDGETINDDVKIETSETDASISKETITEESTTSSSVTTSQNNDPELISNEGEIKNNNEEVKDGLASLVKEDDTKNEIIVNTTKNENSKSTPSVVGPIKTDVDVKEPKNRKNWIIAAISLATVLLISGVVISLSQCDRKTPEEIYKEAKALIDNNQYEKGIAELEKIQENYIPAKALLGSLLTSNDSVNKDLVRGEKLLWEAFEKNDTNAGINLVDLYYTRANWDTIYKVADKLAALNTTKGYRVLAWLHWTDKIGGEINKHKDYSKAEYYALQFAEKDSYCCFYLGWMYDEGGYGIKKDPAKAFYWFKRGAELGDSYSCSNLGILYLNGRGVNISNKKAFESFKKAVSLDSANEHALYNIGCMFYDGQYVKANKDSARYYYQKAAKFGNEEAAITLENDF